MLKLKNLAALAVGMASSAAWACLPGETACQCDSTGAAISSEPAFVSTGTLSVSPVTLVHVFSFDYSLNPSGGPIVDATVNVGDTVRWQWDDGFHSVTSVAGSPQAFDSGAGFGLPPFDQVFNTPGVYNYYCTLHGFDFGNGTAGGMSGKITVNAVPEPLVLSFAAPVLLMLNRRRA